MLAVRKRVPRNTARIEFIACMETIESLLAQGFDKKKIHTRLTESGQFTMAYGTFCDFCAQVAKNGLKLVSLRPVPSKASTPVKAMSDFQQSHPRVIKAKSDELQDPRNIDLKTVF